MQQPRHIRVFSSIVAMGLVLAASARMAEAGSAPALATVVNCSGKVSLARKDGRRERAAVGTRLQLGDKLTTASSASAWIVYRDGRMQKVGASKTLRLGAPQRARAKKRGRIARLLGWLGLFKKRRARLSNAGGGIRPVRGAIYVLRPRRSYTVHAAPRLRWSRLRGAARYRLRIAALSKDIVRQTTTATELQLDKPLRRGQLYFVTVEALSKRGKVLAKDQTTFTVASAKAKRQLERMSQQLERAVGVDPFSYKLLRAELYARKTFYADALAMLERLRTQRRDVRWIDQRIAQLRRKSGLPRRAARSR